ncbi:MAG: protein kinase [Planctomycetia bacterium]|nr:protein kinase [Planctomycetia bacterium]
MPAPTTTDQLLGNLRKSGLVPTDRLAAALAGVDADDGPARVLDRLVAEHLLTPFQAERLRAGKYKGFILGDYVILDQLGGGGTGQVFLAEHNVMHRLAAIKVLTVSASADEVARERFFREARATAVLDHNNVIRVHDLRKDGSVHYLIMEYAGGISLQHLVRRLGPLRWNVAADYVRQAALGLQHIHDHALVHRDVKPGNLLLTHDGTIKLLDLGLVRLATDHESRLTERVDQMILGTADYLAPEQAVSSSTVDIRADIYGLGATFYFLLAGRPMFPDGRTAQKLMWQQLKEPTPIRQLVPDVPEEVAALLHRMLAKDPNARPQTPADVVTALVPWTKEPVPAPDPALMPAPPARRGQVQGVPAVSRVSYSDFLLEELAHPTQTGVQTPRTALPNQVSTATPPPRSAPLPVSAPPTPRAAGAAAPAAPIRPSWSLVVAAAALAAGLATVIVVALTK